MLAIIQTGWGWLDEVIYFLAHLYDGLRRWSVIFFWIAVVLIILSFYSLTALIIRAWVQRGKTTRTHPKTREDSTEEEYLWVFLVPALNEEVTIADSVGRLIETEVTNRTILVINDGSDDETGTVLNGIEHPDLTVLTRVEPNARQGKSEALNDAWRYLHSKVLGEGRFKGWDPQKVIVAIVDADGRLGAEVWRASAYFGDERVGGLQTQVRIYNRDSFLTVCQDLEFGVFASVFQSGRLARGTANMGGNGQFNRLAALDSVVEPDTTGEQGPWRAGRLTEDQDIGLRLIHNGWRGAQTQRLAIDQQGLHSLRALARQRTRWSQGSWQVLDLIWPSIKNKQISLSARADQLWYLLTPIIQSWVGISVILSVVFLATGMVKPDWTLFIIILFYLFTAGPGIFGIMFTKPANKFREVIRNLLLAHLYLFYSWIIYPVVYRALFRQIFGRKTWAKTKRESIDPPREEPYDNLQPQARQ